MSAAPTHDRPALRKPFEAGDPPVATKRAGSPWLLVLGSAGHGLTDLWQHRRQFVANTRWRPPFCLVVDWVAATIIAVEIVAGAHFHH
jgi:hypothetical protein